MNHAIALTDTELATIRAALRGVEMREQEAVELGHKLGIKLTQVRALLHKLPRPE